MHPASSLKCFATRNETPEGKMTERSNPDEDSGTFDRSPGETSAAPADAGPKKNDSENEIIELTEPITEPLEIEAVDLTEEIPESQSALRILSDEFEDLIRISRKLSESPPGDVIDLTEEADLEKRHSTTVQDLPQQGPETASVEATYALERNLKESCDSDMAFETSLGLELDEEHKSEGRGESPAERIQSQVRLQSVLIQIPGDVLPENFLKTLIRDAGLRGDEKLYLQVAVTGKSPSDMPSDLDGKGIHGSVTPMFLLSDEVIASILEKVIKELFAQKIESALEKAAQRIVREDVEKLRSMLFEGIQTGP
jgi:hypothetical protein